MTMQNNTYHDPVLLHASLDGLEINPDGRYADLTFGGGGHSRAILERLGENGLLYAFDQDVDAFENQPNDGRLKLIKANFRQAATILKLHKALPLDGILADLGVSSHQFDLAQRGFSIRFEGPLDMRMDSSQNLNASTIVNQWDEAEIKQVLSEFGEVQFSGRIARAIVERRKTAEISNTQSLVELIKPFAKRGHEHQLLAQVFQALRIAVNDELGALKELLMKTPEMLRPGGRLAVISYHSLEDRLVKQFMRSGRFEEEPEKDLFGRSLAPFKLITKKPIRPDASEIDRNNRSRSALLRIAEKINK